MNMARLAKVWIVLLLLVLVAAAGCARSPEAKKARHLERGDKYAAREQYKEAIIEYRNVLRIDGTNVRAIRNLGVSHYELREMGQAFGFLLKAKELEPDNLDVRLKLGTIYLLGRRPEQARQEATFILEKDPKSLEALALLAGAANAPHEVNAAIRRLEGARADFGDRAKLHLALGTLYLAKRDVEGAERAFKEAVAREPKSAEAHIVLGDFYVGRRDVAQAEREFKAAAAIAPVGSP